MDSYHLARHQFLIVYKIAVVHSAYIEIEYQHISISVLPKKFHEKRHWRPMQSPMGGQCIAPWAAYAKPHGGSMQSPMGGRFALG